MTTPFDYIPSVLDRAMEDTQPIDVKGKVIQVVGTIIKASVPGVKVGEVCILRNPWDGTEVQSEVVGFTKDAVLLTALGAMIGISGETEVIPTRHVQMVPVGKNLLGRVLDGLGRPMDADTKAEDIFIPYVQYHCNLELFFVQQLDCSKIRFFCLENAINVF